MLLFHLTLFIGFQWYSSQTTSCWKCGCWQIQSASTICGNSQHSLFSVGLWHRVFHVFLWSVQGFELDKNDFYAKVTALSLPYIKTAYNAHKSFYKIKLPFSRSAIINTPVSLKRWSRRSLVISTKCWKIRRRFLISLYRCHLCELRLHEKY